MLKETQIEVEVAKFGLEGKGGEVEILRNSH